MQKKILKAGLGMMLAANVLLLNQGLVTTVPVVYGAEGAIIKGKVNNISQKAKTLALSLPNNDFFLLKFTDDTSFEGIDGPKELKEGEAVEIGYLKEGNENIATSVKMEIVTLPPGVTEIKTDELAALMAKNDNVVVVDSRPTPKYDEFHIPGAISIPFAKLTKMGDDGAKLLAKYKDKQLVFYCGGTT